MSADTTDIAIIGGGTGGYAAALRAAQLGQRVVLIERDERLGGTCLLRGCIPTKALLHIGGVLDQISRAKSLGITATAEADWPGMQAFQSKIVDKLVKGLTHLIESRQIDVRHGTAALTPSGGLTVDGTPLIASNIVLATGSKPRDLPGYTIGGPIITSDQALTLPELPGSAIIIGGGAIGLEFASFWRSIGAAVTVIEALPRLAPLEDADISAALARSFRRRRITAHAGTSVTSVAEIDGGVVLSIEKDGASEQLTADVCLVAIGRAPVTTDCGFEEAGIELDHGYVKVDERLATSVPGIWAVGDVASTPLQFAHSAFAEGMAVAERIAGNAVDPIDYDGVARVTFCTPELASVGLTEEAARQRGIKVKTSTFDMQGLGRANILGEGGLTKLVADEEDGRIVGVHMIGPHVTDLISEGMLITNWEATIDDLAGLIHPHPTLGEAIGEAALALAGRPLHGMSP